MLRGRFGDTTTAPYIEASVHFPRLSIRGYVSFLVDTGANSSILMPADSKKLGVDFKVLRNQTTSHGIGGFSKGFEEDAVVAFSDGRHVYGYDVNMEVSSPTADNRYLPSLLGRDVLNRWRIIIDFSKAKATFTPRTWDLRIKL
jgi:hypothetical protein